MEPATNISRGDRLRKQNIKSLLISEEMNGEELTDLAKLSQTALDLQPTFVCVKGSITHLTFSARSSAYVMDL